MRRLRIEVVDSGSGRRAEFRFGESPVRVGRSGLNDLVLDFDFVSQCHAAIPFTEDQIVYMDLGSKNGSLVGGVRAGKRRIVPLAEATEVRIGTLHLKASWEPDGAGGGAGAPPGKAIFRAAPDKPGQFVPPRGKVGDGMGTRVLDDDPAAPAPAVNLAATFMSRPPGSAPAAPPLPAPPPVAASAPALPDWPPASAPPVAASEPLPPTWPPAFAPPVAASAPPAVSWPEPRSPAPSWPAAPPARSWSDLPSVVPNWAEIAGPAASWSESPSPSPFPSMPAPASPAAPPQPAAPALDAAVGLLIEVWQTLQGLNQEAGLERPHGNTPFHRGASADEVYDYLLADPASTISRLRELSRLMAELLAQQMAPGADPRILASTAASFQLPADLAGPPAAARKPSGPVAVVAPSVPMLVNLSTVLPDLQFPLTKAKLTIGRDQERSDVVLNHGSVSRMHAEVINEGGRWTITDLGSSNGLFVNGAPAKTSPLKRGDIIQLGQIQLRFD